MSASKTRAGTLWRLAQPNRKLHIPVRMQDIGGKIDDECVLNEASKQVRTRGNASGMLRHIIIKWAEIRLPVCVADVFRP